jgi:protein tyrosine/serine phosphatase
LVNAKRGIGRLTRTAWALVWALVLMAGAEAGRIGLGSNLNIVVPGRCFRAAQPSGEDVDRYARQMGIRTIINLRGYDEHAWYVREHLTAESHGIRVVDAGFWASAQPTPDEFLHIVRAIDESAEPILLHCESGIDRSGLAAAIYLLLKTDASIDRARQQLSWRFGHFARGRAGCQDRILDAYADWLMERGLRHRPGEFRRWAQAVYHPEAR